MVEALRLAGHALGHGVVGVVHSLLSQFPASRKRSEVSGIPFCVRWTGWRSTSQCSDPRAGSLPLRGPQDVGVEEATILGALIRWKETLGKLNLDL